MNRKNKTIFNLLLTIVSLITVSKLSGEEVNVKKSPKEGSFIVDSPEENKTAVMNRNYDEYLTDAHNTKQQVDVSNKNFYYTRQPYYNDNKLKVQRVHLVQDDAQPFMVSKVYELKYVRAVDIRPWIKAAVKRYDTNSDAQRLNYKFGKKQLLVVTTAEKMIEYVDKIVAVLDRPGILDQDGSVINGTGIYRFAYQPNYRSTRDMVNLLNTVSISGDGSAFLNEQSNIIYWKDSKSDGNATRQDLLVIDRPVPQVWLEFKIYTVRENDLKDIGLDYLAWKNGPGLELFGAGFNALNISNFETIFDLLNSDILSFASSSGLNWGGIFFAPQIDFSFIRLLSQAGLANINNSAEITVVNDYNGSYNVAFNPEYQNIAKTQKDMSEVVVGAPANITLVVEKPYINFKNPDRYENAKTRTDSKPYNIEDYGEPFKTVTDSNIRQETFDGRLYDVTNYGKTGGSITFDYVLSTNEVVERNNYGLELTQTNKVASSLTLDLESEMLLSTWSKTEQIEETIGVPFLSDIPVLKYVFSTTTNTDTTTKYFLTVKGRLVHPEQNLPNTIPGKLLTSQDIHNIMAASNLIKDSDYNEITPIPLKTNKNIATADINKKIAK
ncbi:hypothetical protein AAEX28_06885 [Lentisphaerota bacterium WC36G]|nr:hypothetical protein LJT99_09750 [Lentisphaerae bacterium WC36]